MLVLSRKAGECIQIGEDIGLTVLEIRGGKVRLGVTAPIHVPVHRQEVYLKIDSADHEASRKQSASADIRTRKIRGVGA